LPSELLEDVHSERDGNWPSDLQLGRLLFGIRGDIQLHRIGCGCLHVYRHCFERLRCVVGPVPIDGRKSEPYMLAAWSAIAGQWNLFDKCE
jgi:hypothetical protein